jgi:D-3-phosphoglycerate dehydrogenase
MTYHVVVADRIAPGGLRLLTDTPGIDVVDVAGKGREALEGALREAHALIVRSETRVTADLLTLAPQLVVIARAGTGVDTIDLHTATRRGIAVMNAQGANTVSAAEHAMGLLLSLVRHIPGAAAAMRNGEWDRKRFEGRELRGKVLGVIGLGRIGGHMVQLGRAFGMTVVGHDPFVTAERAAELQVRSLSLDELLRTADVVTLHLALTGETKALINETRLARMKPSAILINTARGELVDEAALAASVRDGHLSGAAIDVFAVEPLPADSPLRGLDRVLLTPHLAASTAEAQDRVALEVCTAVRDALLENDLSCAVNVPGISGDPLRRLRPLLELAGRLGRLVAALVEGAVEQVEVAYGGRDDSAARPVQVAAVSGLLSQLGAGPVSLVNAVLIAEERRIQLSRTAGSPRPGFETTIGVTVHSGGHRVHVVGALTGREQGRVVAIDEYHVDIAPEGWMLVIRNADVPGVIGGVGTVLGRAGINIGSYNQARRTTPGDQALAAITVDQPLTDGVLDELRRLPDVLQVRLANFDP